MGYDPTYGARPLNRVLRKKLLDPLAMRLIKGQVQENETVKVEVKITKFTLFQTTVKGRLLKRKKTILKKIRMTINILKTKPK